MKPREGLLIIDHRNSPGVPDELVRASGFNAPIVKAGVLYETATFACAHCSNIFTVTIKRGRTVGYCRKCDAFICDSPACNAECTPFIKILDELQEAAFKRETCG